MASPRPVNLTLVSRAAPPDDLPVPVATVRDYVLVPDGTDRDAVLRGLILSARDFVEGAAGTILVPTVVREKFECFPWERSLSLGAEPVRAVTEVRYIDVAGVERVMSADDYRFEAGTLPQTIVLKPTKTWPKTQAGELWPVTVTYDAGPAVGQSARAMLVQAVQMMASFFHEHPSAVGRGGELVIPDAIGSLISLGRLRGYP